MSPKPIHPDPLYRAMRLSLSGPRWLLGSVALGVLTIGSAVGLMATSAWLIAQAALQTSIADLQVAIVGVRFFGAARGVFRYAERIVTHEAIFRTVVGIRLWFFRRLEPLAPAGLKKHRSGDLLARLVSDVENFEHIFVRLMSPPVVAVVVAALLGSIYGWFSPALLAASLGFYAAAGLLLPAATMAAGRATGRRIAARRAELQTLLVDHVQGLADLQAFNRGGDHAEKLRRTGASLTALQRRMAVLSGWNEAGMSLMLNGAVLAILLLAIPAAAHGAIPGVMLTVLALTIMAGFEGVAALPAAFQFAEQSRASAARVFEVADTEPEVREPAAPHRLPADSALVFERVSFRHADSDDHTVEDISLSIGAGRHVAFVGPSGAGKTTLAHLLVRFHDPTAGVVRLGGVDLRDLSPADLPSRIALVPQAPFFFNGSIRDNLRLADPAATDDRLWSALETACLDGFVRSLPTGIETDIREQGLRLSGGERRRLALAQALLRDTPVCILDEPTADLDMPTEARLLANLRATLRGRTLILITHRLVGMDTLDAIHVIQDGRLVESGREPDLLSNPTGLYRRLLEIQRQFLDDESAKKMSFRPIFLLSAVQKSL